MSFLLVGAGGVIGAILRYQLSKWIGERVVTSFPMATLLINVTGSLLLGWFTHMLGTAFPAWSTSLYLFLGTGLCGAYTTFSTFTYEWTMLVREGRLRTAWVYLFCSVAFGLTAAAAGLYGLPV